jgi:glyoxylase-like metal-dependent hydrolase (beta-lactamase superfamily II)
MEVHVGPIKVTEGIYLVGDSGMTDSRDCSVYLLDLGELILVDAGAGKSTAKIVENIERAGLDPRKLSTLILTHCHIDHVGGGHYFKEQYDVRIIMHAADAPAVERGDRTLTAAFWYKLDFPPLDIDVKLDGPQDELKFGDHTVVCLHTPGHTPGSLSLYIDRNDERILFGQDIHGPFLPEFGADLTAWRTSMGKLLELDADILCEGHFGVYRSKGHVRDYIERYLEEYS